MSYSQEDLQNMSERILLNVMTSTCDSGVPKYLAEMRQCKAELERRGHRVRLVRVPSRFRPGKTSREARFIGEEQPPLLESL